MLTLYIADVERDVGMKNLSRKEAVKVLEDMKVKIEIPKAAVTQIKKNLALDMAINALNCSEIPNNSDTISREAAIVALANNRCGNDEWDLAVTHDVETIKKIPSVEPERKTGKWIPI